MVNSIIQAMGHKTHGKEIQRMKTITGKIYLFTLLITLTASLYGYSQGVAINADGSAPDASAALDINSANKGLLIPRVALTSTSSNEPVGSGIATSLMVYNTATVNDVIPGYYYWDGNSWIQFNAPETGSQSLNIVYKTSSGPIAKTETMVIATGDITLTLPAVTSADNGLQITILNAGTYKDLVVVKGAAPGVTIHSVDSVLFYRGYSKTLVAVNGIWAKKEHMALQDNVFEISNKSSWNTIGEAVAFLKEHMTGPSVIRLGGGTYEIDTTLTINLPYPVTIEGVSYGEAIIQGSAGLSGHEMFNCQSECYFKMITFQAVSNTSGNDGIHLTGSGEYYEIKDCEFDGFYKGIAVTRNCEMWLFETDFYDITSIAVSVEDASGSSDGPVIKMSETDYTNCGTGIKLVKGKNGIVDIVNCTFYNSNAGQTGILYVPGLGNFQNFTSMFITNNSWNNIGTFMSGFDFTRADGRDVNAFIENNAGMGNKNPYVKVNVISNTASTDLPDSRYYYQANFVNTSSFPCKWKVENNKITYLPANKKDVVMTVAGNIAGTSGSYITIAVGKNGQTVYAPITIRSRTNGTYFAFTTVAYIENVSQGDYFEIYINSSSSFDDAILSDLNWWVDTK